MAEHAASRGCLGWSQRCWRQGLSLCEPMMRRTGAAEMSATIPAAMSWRASSRHSPWERLRPRRSGRSQARRTTSIATSGGKTARGAAARSVAEALQALGQKPLRPLADDDALDAAHLRHLALRVSVSQQQDHASPAHQPCRHGGRSLPAWQELPLLGG